MTPLPSPNGEVSASWRSVRTVEAMIRSNTGPVLCSLLPHATGFARVPESLLLIFGVTVLEGALLRLRDEGSFASQRSELGALMRASKTVLAWQNYEVVDQIRLRRNKVAHRGQLLSAGECSNALNAIARELLAWHVMAEDPKIDFTVSFTPDVS